MHSPEHPTHRQGAPTCQPRSQGLMPHHVLCTSSMHRMPCRIKKQDPITCSSKAAVRLASRLSTAEELHLRTPGAASTGCRIPPSDPA